MKYVKQDKIKLIPAFLQPIEPPIHDAVSWGPTQDAKFLAESATSIQGVKSKRIELIPKVIFQTTFGKQMFFLR
jgi:hypothetical protein